MALDQLRIKLHKQIDQLNDIQLEELNRLMVDILPEKKNASKKRPFGLRKGSLNYMADDFDAPLTILKNICLLIIPATSTNVTLRY
uniref:Uncharacterized protein n=1 Tax=Roseihalotalea indica TaxID=2867963 RepID=A0AA49JG99_9BACT|nr:hypothetical protein K4G66_13160 [Tunicatimonas sp. TK19036]